MEVEWGGNNNQYQVFFETIFEVLNCTFCFHKLCMNYWLVIKDGGKNKWIKWYLKQNDIVQFSRALDVKSWSRCFSDTWWRVNNDAVGPRSPTERGCWFDDGLKLWGLTTGTNTFSLFWILVDWDGCATCDGTVCWAHLANKKK